MCKTVTSMCSGGSIVGEYCGGSNNEIVSIVTSLESMCVCLFEPCVMTLNIDQGTVDADVQFSLRALAVTTHKMF